MPPLTRLLGLAALPLCGCGQYVIGPDDRGWGEVVVADFGQATIVDARSAEEYALGHVPGATNVHWTELTGMDEHGLWDALPPDQLADLLGQRGISMDEPVVVYGSGPDGYGDDGNVYWALRWLGHPDVRVYDGGWTSWVAQGGALSTAPGPGPTVFEPAPHPPVYAGTHDVAEWEGTILDVRSREEWDQGRIPGAVWLEWTTVFDHDHTLREPEELLAMLEAAGMHPDEPVVTYCQGGIRAGHTFMVLEALGFEDVANYVGSWARWTAEGGEVHR